MRPLWFTAMTAGIISFNTVSAQTVVPGAHSTAVEQRDRVQRDLELWHAAGMSFLPSNVLQEDVKQTPEYRRYQQLRAENDLQERFARQLEMEPTAATRAQPLPTPASIAKP